MKYIEAIGYARISTNTEKQNIKQQEEVIRKFAESKGYKIEKIFKDIKTGKSDDRKGYRNMISFLRKNPEHTLIVQDTDRLTRNFYDGVEFEKMANELNISILSTSEHIDLTTPNGRFMFRIKLAMNSFYVENLLDKIKIGIERAKKEGKFTGRKPGSKNRKVFKRNKKKKSEHLSY